MKFCWNFKTSHHKYLLFQGFELSSTMYPRPGSKDFKAASKDEMPSETAILDAAKLGVRRYQCPICLLIVRDRHDLKRHLRTHTKIKPYSCQLCNRNFARKWDLDNHLRRHQEESLKEITKAPLTMVDLDELQFQISSMGKSIGKGNHSGGEDGELKGDNSNSGNDPGSGLLLDNHEEEDEEEERLFLDCANPNVIIKQEPLDESS